MAEVVRLADHLEEIGDNYRFDPDELLENAKDGGFTNLLILGQCADGTLYVSGVSNVGMALVMMELAKHQLIHGE
jgi:hypothetical protein